MQSGITGFAASHVRLAIAEYRKLLTYGKTLFCQIHLKMFPGSVVQQDLRVHREEVAEWGCGFLPIIVSLPTHVEVVLACANIPLFICCNPNW